ncbi:MAG TPA: M42 family metallopeptidase [Thermomicrobiales bacterium]|nr:M42 family metallopeptidase [Thermomicrobiales bacterium]
MSEATARDRELPPVDGDYMLQQTAALCGIPSPSGFTQAAVDSVAAELERLGVTVRRTVKGALVASLASDGVDGEARTLSAHVDTLGAMVKEIKDDGRLKLAMIGHYDWATIEGEYCTIHTAGGARPLSGSVLTTKASGHVHGKELTKLKRDERSIEVRVDEPIRSAGDARRFGIDVGDFVSFDPRTVVTASGFIKSRHLDDKACVAILLGVAKALAAADAKPAAPSHLFISNFEEVGHGSSAGLPADTRELIAVDMAAVGTGQTSDEFATTVCVKDSSGPYDFELSQRLIGLARAHDIDCRVDIYPYYASDVSQALRAGWDVKGGLVGPGVDASHSYERLHRTALETTARLLLAYLLSPAAATDPANSAK